MKFPAKIPSLFKYIYPNLTWHLPRNEKVLYLTFDDGPTPEVTEWTLAQLDKYNAMASFFCIGENVERYPVVFEQVKQKGHLIGNHTYRHFNGWEVSNAEYYEDIARCSRLVRSRFFRPPFGRITPIQSRYIFENPDILGTNKPPVIVMWEVVSFDFDKTLDETECLNNVLDNAQAGSIVVFHDSENAAKNLKFALPKVLEHFAQQGFRFEKLPFEA